jgi:hypothetical protein
MAAVIARCDVPTIVAYYSEARMPKRVGGYHPVDQHFRIFDELDSGQIDDQVVSVGWKAFTAPGNSAKQGRFLCGPFLTGNQYSLTLKSKPEDYVALFPLYPRSGRNIKQSSEVDPGMHETYLLVSLKNFKAKGWDIYGYGNAALVEHATMNLGEVVATHKQDYTALLVGK